MLTLSVHEHGHLPLSKPQLYRNHSHSIEMQGRRFVLLAIKKGRAAGQRLANKT